MLIPKRSIDIFVTSTELAVEVPTKDIFLLQAVPIQALLGQVDHLDSRPDRLGPFERASDQIEPRVVISQALDVGLPLAVDQLLFTSFNQAYWHRFRVCAFYSDLLIESSATSYVRLRPIGFWTSPSVGQALVMVVEGGLGHGRVHDSLDRPEHQRIDDRIRVFRCA